MVTNALVDAFIMATDHDQIAHQTQGIGIALIETLSIWCHVQHRLIVALALKFFYTGYNRFTLHHHAGASTVLIIIDLLVFAGTKFTQLMYMYFGNAFIRCTLEYAMRKRALQASGITEMMSMRTIIFS